MPAEWTSISLPQEIINPYLPLVITRHRTQSNENVLLISIPKPTRYSSDVGIDGPITRALSAVLDSSSDQVDQICFDATNLTLLNASGLRDLAACLDLLREQSSNPPQFSLVCTKRLHRVLQIVGFDRFIPNVYLVESDVTPVKPAIDPNHHNTRGDLQEFNGF